MNEVSDGTIINYDKIAMTHHYITLSTAKSRIQSHVIRAVPSPEILRWMPKLKRISWMPSAIWLK